MVGDHCCPYLAYLRAVVVQPLVQIYSKTVPEKAEQLLCFGSLKEKPCLLTGNSKYWLFKLHIDEKESVNCILPWQQFFTVAYCLYIV